MKKVLVPGGTGAMGVYLVPELLSMGYAVDVISMDDIPSENPNLRYICANAKDSAYISEVLKQDYDAVVDFMIYPTQGEMDTFLPMYLANTGHYIYLSTYRVYADKEHPIRETSPRLLDAETDQAFLNSGDYSIYKAQGEELLKASGKDHWTIIRPAITYSKRRFQLVTMEMNLVMRRMLEGKPVMLPEPALTKQTTMSWAGDVAKMIARLTENKAAYRESYSVCTAEHHTWQEIADMYNRIGGLTYQTVSTEEYMDVVSGDNILLRQQLTYDRYYDRIMDNSKILQIAGMKQSELMPLEKGLQMEYDAFPKHFRWGEDAIYDRMESYFANHG